MTQRVRTRWPLMHMIHPRMVRHCVHHRSQNPSGQMDTQPLNDGNSSHKCFHHLQGLLHMLLWVELQQQKPSVCISQDRAELSAAYCPIHELMGYSWHHILHQYVQHELQGNAACSAAGTDSQGMSEEGG